MRRPEPVVSRVAATGGSRSIPVDDPSAGEAISEQFRVAFAEDKDILQAVQEEEDRHAGEAKIGLDLDASAGLFRLKINRMIRAEMQAAIRQHLNPLFKIHDLVIVDSLPRTASNKLMRRTLRTRFNQKP